jgi:ribulose 1,5-bisphosphate synthetase/thiazole synthase
MESTTSLATDVIVLGFGKGGKTAAHVPSNTGQRAVLIDQSEDMYGGTGLLWFLFMEEATVRGDMTRAPATEQLIRIVDAVTVMSSLPSPHLPRRCESR